MKMNILILLFAFFALNSCKDVIGLDSNLEKDLLKKKLSPSDSLNFLTIHDLDFGSLKIGTANHDFVSIVNNSSKDTILIYKLDSTDKSGLFSYNFPQGFPFKVNPGEDINLTNKIEVHFIADDFKLNYHYDTLVINNNKNFVIKIKAKVRG